MLSGLAMGLTLIGFIYSPWGQRSGAHMNPALTLSVPGAGQDRALGRGLLRAGAIRRRARWASCSRPLASAPRCAHPCGQLRRDGAGPAGPASRSGRSSPSRLCMMIAGAGRLEHKRLSRFTAVARGCLVATLHHRRSAALRHEHEPGAHVRVRASRRRVDRALDLLHGAAARHAAGRATLSLSARRAPRLLRQAASPQRRTLHLPLQLREQLLQWSVMQQPLRRHHHRHRRGRRHARLQARADRQEDPAPRARRLRAAREGQLELARRQRRGQVQDEGSRGATRTASELHPHTNYYVGGNTKFYGAALFRLREEDFGEIRHHGGISPAWPISYDELEPYYTQAEQLYHVHGERGEDPDRAAARAGRIRIRPSATSRASSSWATTSRGSGCGRSTCRSASCSTSRIRSTSACIRCDTCDGFPCLVHAKSDAQVLLRRSGARASERHAADQRLRRAAGDQRVGPRSHRGRRRAQRRDARRYSGRRRGRLVRRDQLRGAAAALGERQASATASPTAPTSSAATTWATSTRS